LKRTVTAVVLAAMVTSSCGYTVVSQQRARVHCESLYCAGYDPVTECPHYNDLVVICIEDNLADRQEASGWWARFIGGLIDLLT